MIPVVELPHRNPKNQFINTSFLEKLFKKFGVTGTVSNLKLYQQAFIHESFVVTPKLEEQASQIDLSEYAPEQIESWSETIPMQRESYERLEFVGDSIICLVVADYLYHRYPNQDQGFLTKTRIELVKKETLAKLTGRLKWGQYLMLSRTLESHRYSDINLLEDVFESFIGALYLDFGGHLGDGLKMAYQFIISVIERYINLSRIIHRDDNYKDLLLQYYHKTFDGQFPRYKAIDTKNQYNQRMYTAGVLNIDNHVIVQASDPKKTRAEQKASRLALIYYDQDVCSSSEDEGDDYWGDSESE